MFAIEFQCSKEVLECSSDLECDEWIKAIRALQAKSVEFSSDLKMMEKVGELK